MTDTLDKLKKAFEQAISTATAVQPWNEPLTRRDAVQPGQVLTTPLVQGGLGSWTGSSGFPYTGTTVAGVQTGAQPPARNSFELGLGLPGVPDVDFVPYAAGTNRFGGKGPALIGHPISWEVVGPTLKSPYCDWQWHVDTTGLTNDVLTLEAGPYPMLTGGLPSNISPQAYGPNLAGFDAVGGLYVLFTFTGEGFTGSLAGGRTPLTPAPKSYRASFELFRVLSIDAPALSIVLRGEKRVASVFPFGGDGCRAITLVRPKVTRLAAFPVPVVGQVQSNRTFVFLPPETAATSEFMPPNKTAGLGTWSAGGFDVAGTIPGGNTSYYGNPAKLPIPRPVARVDAEIPLALVPPLRADEWQISVPVGSGELKVGRIVRISNLTDSIPSQVSPNAKHAYGYFEIRSITVGPPDILFLGRVTEANPDTGEVFYGNGPFAVTAPVPVSLEVYENVSTIFSGTMLNLEKLASARLVNLIDPRTVGPSITRRDTDGSPVPASKPDRAIFNTRLGEDPGNLLDLGFRTVLFPAKVLGGNAVPDFDKPIDSNEAMLDPSVSERQYVEIDYSAGVAYLSHTPAAGNPACEVAPSLAPFAAANNPRQEVVLFAACVPYSMEEGQSGSGFRITGSSPDSINGGLGANDLADVFGRRIIAEPYGALQTLDPSTAAPITTTLSSLGDIPPSGFFFVGYALPGTIFTTQYGPYYYQYTDAPLGRVRLNGITGPAGAVPLDPTLPDGSKIVLQRSLRSFAPTNASADTVRGSSKRVNTLAFKNADLSFGADGSVTVEPRVVGFGLDDAYRQGLAATPGVGRVVVSDGGPVELRPAGSSANPISDLLFLPAQVRSRYDLGVDGTGDKAGFDFLGRRSNVSAAPYGGIDNFAGFMDRRVFAPQTLLGYTILGDLASGNPHFNVSVVAADQIHLTTAGNQFHDGGATNRTLLVNDLDLVHLDGLGVYVFHQAVGGSPGDYLIRNLDGSVPALAFPTPAKGCLAYRPRFATGRSFDGGAVLPVMGGTWITSQGEKPALRLYAGSGTVFGGPDEGGSTESLEFWYRSQDKTPRSDNSFDTYGRLLGGSVILSAADLSLRGPYLTRSRQVSNFGGNAFALGHVFETSTIGAFAPDRSFDFLSLHANSMGTLVGAFNYTVIAADTVRLATASPGFTHRRLSLSGGTFVDLTSYTGAGDHIGLYRVIGTTNPGGAGTADLQLLRLDNTVPALDFAGPATGSSQVFTAAYTGTGQDSYYDFAGVLQTHQPTTMVGVGEVNTSVGLHVSGPDPVIVTGGKAIRVTSLNGPANQADERFSVGLDGTTTGYDFGYGQYKLKNVVIPMSEGTPVLNAGVAEWDLQYLGGVTQWYSLASRSEVFFPLHIPNDCSIVNVLVVVTPKNAVPLAVNRVQARLLTLDHDFTTPAVPTATIIGEAADDGTINTQVLDLRNAPGLGFGVDQVVGYTSGTKEWVLRVISGNAGLGDLLYSIQVQLKINRPAPL